MDPTDHDLTGIRLILDGTGNDLSNNSDYEISYCHLQHRVYAEGSERTNAWIEMTYQGKPIIGSHVIEKIELLDAAGSLVGETGGVLLYDDYLWGGWNGAEGRVVYEGPSGYSGTSIHLNPAGELPGGFYFF